MNYRHAFHAGNHGDVLKHVVLCRVLSYMVAKDKPMAVLDAHAGIGVYDLAGPEALKTGEWNDGVGRLLASDLPEDVRLLLQPYLDVIGRLNEDGALRAYGGSPEIASQICRAGDRLYFNELHPDDHAALALRYGNDRRVRVSSVDALQVVKSALPFAEHRGVVIIDPPYEERGETEKVIRMISQGLKRMAHAAFVVWYPVTTEKFAASFLSAVHALGAPGMLHLQLRVRESHDATGLSGSGVIVINPPWTLHTECQAILPFLAKALGKGPWGGSTVEWLTAPRS